MPDVELVYDQDCPNVAQARANLVAAFAQANVAPRWSEHLIGDAPPHARGFGSPTILVDGHDVAGASAGASDCCRIYVTEDRALTGAPDVATIADAIAAAAGTEASRR